MKISKGIIPFSLAAGVFLSGSARKLAPKNIEKSGNNLPAVVMKSQSFTDSFRIHTFDYTDDGPVLPKPRLK